MRSYYVEGLEEKQIEKLSELLTSMDMQGSMPGLFWLPIPTSMHTEIQNEHAQQCGPYVMAFEIERAAVRLEFLVRARNALHCNCVGYATPALQMHMMAYVEELFTKLDITI